MSTAAESFIGEQVREAIDKKYPELAESWAEMPKWAYDCWSESNLLEKFTVTMGEDLPTTTIEVTVGFEVDGDDDGRYIVAYVVDVCKVVDIEARVMALLEGYHRALADGPHDAKEEEMLTRNYAHAFISLVKEVKEIGEAT